MLPTEKIWQPLICGKSPTGRSPRGVRQPSAQAALHGLPLPFSLGIRKSDGMDYQYQDLASIPWLQSQHRGSSKLQIDIWAKRPVKYEYMCVCLCVSVYVCDLACSLEHEEDIYMFKGSFNSPFIFDLFEVWELGLGKGRAGCLAVNEDLIWWLCPDAQPFLQERVSRCLPAGSHKVNANQGKFPTGRKELPHTVALAVTVTSLVEVTIISWSQNSLK